MKISPLNESPSPKEFYRFRVPREELYLSSRGLSWTLQGLNEEAWDTKGYKKIHPKGGDDLFSCIRVPLVIGALLGLIPIQSLLTPSPFHPHKQRFSWIHYRTLISVLVTSLILLNTFFISHNFALVLWHEHNSAGKLVLTFSGVWFYSAGTLVYFFFLFRSQRLCIYFKKWLRLSGQLGEMLIPDTSVTRHVNLICIVVLIDCLGENTLLHFHSHANQPEHRRTDTLTFENLLEDFFASNQYLSWFFGYHPLVAALFLVINKLTTYAWNFGDVFLMVVFRVMYSRFESLNRFLNSLMVAEGSVCLIRKGRVKWESIRKTFLRLTNLLEEGNALLAPLIWLSYTTDIFFVCRQLYEGLSPTTQERWLISKVYVGWSLFHLIVRTIGVNLMAAKINEHAHGISKILQHCVPEEYDDNVRRLETFLGSRVIGITGNGCFVITRSFILMVISAIFTLEVVLLQNASLTVS